MTKPAGLDPVVLRDCERVLREYARSFYFASHLLPGGVREDVCLLYAVCRRFDDLSDGDDVEPERSRRAITRWRAWLRDPTGEPGEPVATDDPIVPALRYLLVERNLPARHLDHLLDGIESDLAPRWLESFAELERYAEQVAGTVGWLMAFLLGVRDAQALGRARDLGIAMQLTNVLRDVGEDLGRGRVYLPQSELERFGCDLERFRAGIADDGLLACVRFQIDRARAYYERGRVGLAAVPSESRPAIALAAELYSGILDVVERAPHRIFSHRAQLGQRAKLWRAARLLFWQGYAWQAIPLSPTLARRTVTLSLAYGQETVTRFGRGLRPSPFSRSRSD